MPDHRAMPDHLDPYIIYIYIYIYRQAMPDHAWPCAWHRWALAIIYIYIYMNKMGNVP